MANYILRKAKAESAPKEAVILQHTKEWSKTFSWFIKKNIKLSKKKT